MLCDFAGGVAVCFEEGAVDEAFAWDYTELGRFGEFEEVESAGVLDVD